MRFSIFDKIKKTVLPRNDFIISKEQDEFIKKVLKDTESYCANSKSSTSPQKVLYIPSYYHISFPRIIDIFMATSLRIRGCEIVPVLTGFFHTKECVIYGGIYNENRKKRMTEYDYVERKIWNEFLKTKSLSLDNFRTISDIRLALEYAEQASLANYKELYYKGFPVGEKAMIVALNMSNMPEVENNKTILNQFKIHVSNIIELINAYERIFDEEKPDIVFSNVPFYYKWSVPYHIARGKNIHFYSAMLGERKNALFFQHNIDKLYDCSPAWPTFSRKSLTDCDKMTMENLINQRLQREAAHYSPYPVPNKESEEFRNLRMRISKDKPLVLFPVNVLFDAIVYQETPAFSNIIDMLIQTIDFFNQNEQYQLIIKAHPAEKLFYHKWLSSKYCLKNILVNLNRKLRNNIIFIDYDSAISTYDIIPLIDLGIAYTSSTVMEMAWFGKPVISVAECHYNSKGFTSQPNNDKEYFELINRILTDGDSQSVNERIELSKRYYLLYFGHAYVDFKMLQGSDTGVVPDRFLFESYEDLLPGRCEALDYICDSIINKLPIYGENRWPPATL